MQKRELHHLMTNIQQIKPVYFLGVAVVSGAVCVFSLRANNQHMIQLRDAVYSADKNNTDIQAPLGKLQAYVTTHMNTDLSAGNTAVYPPIQLKYTYERLVQAQGAATAAANEKIYNDAQHYCEQQNSTDVSGRNRVPCIEQYVQTHNTQATIIPDDLYKFSFASPRWSPDLAGWSMVLTVVTGLLAVAVFIITRTLRFLSK